MPTTRRRVTNAQTSNTPWLDQGGNTYRYLRYLPLGQMLVHASNPVRINCRTNKSQLINMCIHHNLTTHALCDSLCDTTNAFRNVQNKDETWSHNKFSQCLQNTKGARRTRRVRRAAHQPSSLDLKTPVTCWIASLIWTFENTRDPHLNRPSSNSLWPNYHMFFCHNHDVHPPAS